MHHIQKHKKSTICDNDNTDNKVILSLSAYLVLKNYKKETFYGDYILHILKEVSA